MKYYYESNELTHYGVPGMKWGKRKALQKMSRYERKYQKYQDRADANNLAKSAALEGRSLAKGGIGKASSKISSAGTVGLAKNLATRSAGRAVDRAATKVALKAGERSIKAQMKADKWKKKLDKVANKHQIDLGKGTVDEYLLKQIGG